MNFFCHQFLLSSSVHHHHHSTHFSLAFRCHNQRYFFLHFSSLSLSLFSFLLLKWCFNYEQKTNFHRRQIQFYFLYAHRAKTIYSNDEDTDSLEIKPPQMISRYDKHKKSSSSGGREKKHSRSEHRHKDRQREHSDRHAARQHHSTQSSGRHHAPGPDPYNDKYHSLSSRDSSSHHKRFVCFSFHLSIRKRSMTKTNWVILKKNLLFVRFVTDENDTVQRKQTANAKWKICVVDCWVSAVNKTSKEKSKSIKCIIASECVWLTFRFISFYLPLSA